MSNDSIPSIPDDYDVLSEAAHILGDVEAPDPDPGRVHDLCRQLEPDAFEGLLLWIAAHAREPGPFIEYWRWTFKPGLSKR